MNFTKRTPVSPERFKEIAEAIRRDQKAVVTSGGQQKGSPALQPRTIGQDNHKPVNMAPFMPYMNKPIRIGRDRPTV
jgi:hypothetical protein